jgi:hypothetical protein
MAPPRITDPETPRFALGPAKFLLDDPALPPPHDLTAASTAPGLAAATIVAGEPVHLA